MIAFSGRPGGDVGGGDLARLAGQLGGVLPRGEGVQVDDAEQALHLVLQGDELHQRAEIVAEVQVAGGLHAGEDAAGMGGGVGHGGLCRPSAKDALGPRCGGRLGGTARRGGVSMQRAGLEWQPPRRHGVGFPREARGQRMTVTARRWPWRGTIRRPAASLSSVSRTPPSLRRQGVDGRWDPASRRRRRRRRRRRPRARRGCRCAPTGSRGRPPRACGPGSRAGRGGRGPRSRSPWRVREASLSITTEEAIEKAEARPRSIGAALEDHQRSARGVLQRGGEAIGEAGIALRERPAARSPEHGRCRARRRPAR